MPRLTYLQKLSRKESAHFGTIKRQQTKQVSSFAKQQKKEASDVLRQQKSEARKAEKSLFKKKKQRQTRIKAHKRVARKIWHRLI